MKSPGQNSLVAFILREQFGVLLPPLLIAATVAATVWNWSQPWAVFFRCRTRQGPGATAARCESNTGEAARSLEFEHLLLKLHDASEMPFSSLSMTRQILNGSAMRHPL